MTLKYDLSQYANLHERLPEFAEVTGRLVVSLGLEKTGGRGPKAEPASDRVIRDYVSRRVLSPTLRGPESDERGFYGFRHLVEFLAARVLLNDGWPLEKIAERHVGASTEDLLALIPGQAAENDALLLARSFREAAAHPWGVRDAPKDLFEDSWRPTASLARSQERDPQVSDPNVAAARRRAELPLLMRQITGDQRPPKLRRVIALEFGDRLTLLIDQDMVRQMSIAEADTIGRAVSAALIDYPNLVRGKEPK